MDAIKGFFIAPFYGIYTYGMFITAVIINTPAIIIRLMTKGPKSLRKVTDLYDFCKTIPMGKTLISGCIGIFAPYTSSIGAYVEDISDHKCIVSMNDYPWLRNPFQSLHALALGNLGESATGIAMICQLEKYRNIKGIPIKISSSYYKKARGTITAIGHVNLEGVTKDQEMDVVSELYDHSKTLICKTTVTWSLRVKDKEQNEYISKSKSK